MVFAPIVVLLVYTLVIQDYMNIKIWWMAGHHLIHELQEVRARLAGHDLTIDFTPNHL